MSVLKNLQSIFSIFLMIFLGYYLTHRKWFDDKSSKLLSRLVSGISVPAYMISSVVTNFNKDKLSTAGVGLIVPLLSILITCIFSIIVARIFKINPKRRGTFQTVFFVSNTLFIGLPVNLSLFGEVSTPYVLFYYITNTLFFWTIGVYWVSQNGSEEKSSIFNVESLKKILNPPLIGFIIALTLVLLEIKPPSFIMDTCRYLGNLTTPLSMLFIGTTIYSIELRKIRPDLDMLLIMIGRFVISPLVVIFLSYIFPMPVLMKQVFIIQASMPVMTQTAIIARAYDSDYEFAAVMVAVTTMASLFSIPFYMALIQ